MNLGREDFSRKTMFYGRARRLTLMKFLGIVFAVVLGIVLVFNFVSHTVDFHDDNVNFAYLKNYFVAKGFSCEQIDKDGGRCYLSVSDTGNFYSFIRYSNGFYYMVKSSSYMLEIRHVSNTYNDITFKTNSNALSGEKNKSFVCTTSKDVFGKLESCKTSSNEELSSSTYLGVVERGIEDVNLILEASGYKKDKMIKDYVWEK